ncbi:hypothetical protein [Methylobacterium haplocladii]|uniref:Uncharacterized protein n=1 Tax=Methylobacterium haplocladii TaxID=1176176 RepID=A0A512IS12_9HYPH|nr:hypothetical protein [Methylobacterium haplocladii]GEP00497.1 hypothetical protein MHA02_28840 [Methylobacterium haplocladii]GJD82481.1 hypothetical protein HPGCJGGD_0337 [Methylobacterium haplocladii]GLS59566.1 hypothetical protein GCM10007887_22350 [Methylobacterium haplocladii]
MALAIGVTCLSGVPAEAAGRPQAKAARHIAKAPRTTPAKAARTATPSLEAKATELQTASTTPTGVWTSGEQERACFRGRRKLWQPGEGWVVKKVNLCP